MATAATSSTIIQCPACGAKNRVSADKLANGEAPVCGRCRTPLPARGASASSGADGAVRVITDANFAELVERSPVPVLVDLWAPWCGPCRAIAPTIEKLARDYAGRVRVGKLNVDENSATANLLEARGIPLLVIYKNGREFDRLVGLHQGAEIARRLERALGG
jgi:thioredoxin 2